MTGFPSPPLPFFLLSFLFFFLPPSLPPFPDYLLIVEKLVYLKDTLTETSHKLERQQSSNFIIRQNKRLR